MRQAFRPSTLVARGFVVVDATSDEAGCADHRSHRGKGGPLDADTGQIMAAELTINDIDDGSQVGSLPNQVTGPIASFTGDGAYDRDNVYDAVAERYPDAAVIVPPRSTAVPSETANRSRRSGIGICGKS